MKAILIFTLLLLPLIQMTVSSKSKPNLQNLYEAFRTNGLIADLVGEIPRQLQLLNVKYDSGAVVMAGNQLPVIQVKNPPKVSWVADPNKFYTLIFIDPDAPSRLKPTNKEWQHWLVGNIPGNQIENGEEIVEYKGPSPPKRSGLHRYTFLVFEQPGELEFDEPRLQNTNGKGRAKFNTLKFAKKYGLEKPIAGNFYVAQWGVTGQKFQ